MVEEAAPLDVRVGGSTSTPTAVTDEAGNILDASGTPTDVNLFDRPAQTSQDAQDAPIDAAGGSAQTAQAA